MEEAKELKQEAEKKLKDEQEKGSSNTTDITKKDEEIKRLNVDFLINIDITCKRIKKSSGAWKAIRILSK